MYVPAAFLLGRGPVRPCWAAAVCRAQPVLGAHCSSYALTGHPGRLGCGACCCRGASSGGVKAGNRVPGSLHTAHGQSAGGWPCPVQCCPTPCSLEEGSLGRTSPLLWRVPHEVGGGPGTLTNLTGVCTLPWSFLLSRSVVFAGCGLCQHSASLSTAWVIYLFQHPGVFWGWSHVCTACFLRGPHPRPELALASRAPSRTSPSTEPRLGQRPCREGRLARVTPAQPCPSRPEA